MGDPRKPRDEGRLIVTQPIESSRSVPAARFLPPPRPAPSREAVAAEMADRARTRPIELWRAGTGHRRAAFASTMRGVVALTGGKRSGKTFTAGAKIVSIAEQRHNRMCCPTDCTQWGVGSCGVHCCPNPERGSADFRPMGCVAGNTRYCPIHPPFIFDGPIFIIIGCLDLPRFWGPIYNDTLKRLLTRRSNGRPSWTEDKQNSRIIGPDESYIIQALPYDKVSRIESWNPHLFVWDEFAPHEFFQPSLDRVLDKNTQLLISATAYKLLQGEQQWVVNEIKQKASIPEYATQLLSISALDNQFLDAGARERVRQRAELLKLTNEQAYRVVILGELYVRQDACVFSKRAIENQAPFIKPGKTKWAIVSPPTDDGSRDRYYAGETRFPMRCNLPPNERNELLIQRLDSQHTGTACYDCIRKCSHEEKPPRSMKYVDKPYISDERVDLPGVESIAVTVWGDGPDPAHAYAAFFDVAKGVIGGDYCVGCVFDAHTGEQVMSFRGQIGQSTYEAVIAAIWDYFKNWGRGGLCIESNGIGYSLAKGVMLNYGIPASDMFHRLDRHKRHILSGQPMVEVGFITTRGSKSGQASTLATPYGDYASPAACLNARLETRDLVIHDHVTYSELQTFVQVEGLLGGLPGTHDDAAIACMGAAFIVQIVERTSQYGGNKPPNDAHDRLTAPDDEPDEPLSQKDDTDMGDESANSLVPGSSMWSDGGLSDAWD